MEQESCFICGVKIGRGNRTEVGSQEKMEKLISVSNTVEHSSTIISDILSRILNETVMREEIVCRICYNLLNDVDYHLKEAQEKTDEITAKFLDKEKDPLQYRPIKLLDPRDSRKLDTKLHRKGLRDFNERKSGRRGEERRSGGRGEESDDERVSDRRQEMPTGKRREKRSHSKLVTTTGMRPDSKYFSRNQNIEYSHSQKKDESVDGRLSSSSHHRQLSTPGYISPNNSYRLSPPSPTLESEVEGGGSSADEMTVNLIAEKKRRLISRVLGPGKRARAEVRAEEQSEHYDYSETVQETDHADQGEGTSRYDELTIEITKEKEDLREIERRRKKERKRKKKEKEKERRERREREEMRSRQDTVLKLDHQNSEKEELKENTSPQRNKEIRTVDLAQLDHLFSTTQETKQVQLLARKSVPTPAERKQMDFSQQPQQYFILPDKSDNIDLGEITVGQVIAEANPLDGDVTVDRNQISLKMHGIHEITVTATNQPVHTNIVQHTQVELNSQQIMNDTPGAHITGNEVQPKDKKSPSIPCPHCDKKFMRGHNMRVHIHRVHTKFKPFKCQFCEKSFATSSDLKQHMSSHGLGKIHKCADCGRQFNNRDSAILHRKQHNNERTHVCVECGKGFFKASCLTRHQRCHTGEKPYQCDFCQRNFAQLATLKCHKKVCKFAADSNQGGEGGPTEVHHS